jgi:hypothetical protein
VATTKPVKSPAVVEDPFVFEPEKETALVARTMTEFQNLVAQAKISGLKEITVTSDILKFLQQNRYDGTVGYMIYQDVWLFEEGRKDEVLTRDRSNARREIFKNSSVKINAPMSTTTKNGTDVVK